MPQALQLIQFEDFEVPFKAEIYSSIKIMYQLTESAAVQNETFTTVRLFTV